eukprot:GHVQ01039248.1.p1 GENE.GHVQ01039248.1~~GHVQ01039248.1.p1  ORF type:complete len:250 (+),score=5.61 GHVQ01039248.1:144-893(+)
MDYHAVNPTQYRQQPHCQLFSAPSVNNGRNSPQVNVFSSIRHINVMVDRVYTVAAALSYLKRLRLQLLVKITINNKAVACLTVTVRSRIQFLVFYRVSSYRSISTAVLARLGLTEPAIQNSLHSSTVKTNITVTNTGHTRARTPTTSYYLDYRRVNKQTDHNDLNEFLANAHSTLYYKKQRTVLGKYESVAQQQGFEMWPLNGKKITQFVASLTVQGWVSYIRRSTTTPKSCASSIGDYMDKSMTTHVS